MNLGLGDLELYIAQLYAYLPENIYLRALAIFVVFFIIAKGILFISERVLMRIAKRTKTKVDDLIISKSRKPISFIVILTGFRIAISVLNLSAEITFVIGKVLSTLVVFLGVWIAISIIKILIDNWGRVWAERTESTVDDNLIKIIHRITKLLVWVVGFMFILDIWGVNITPLLASLGIAGIAVAFAMQKTLGNIFGGISMIIDRSIKVGDIIKLDEDTMGTVIDVGIRSTRIRTFDNEVIILPNGKLADMKIKNYEHPDKSGRLVIPFSVAYGSNVDKVKKIVLNEINNVDEIIKKGKKAPFVRFNEMGESSLNFKVYIWLADYRKRWTVKDIVNTGIYNALNREKIKIPFPQMDVHLKK